MRKIAERDRRESLVYDLQVDFKKSARLGTELIIYIHCRRERARAAIVVYKKKAKKKREIYKTHKKKELTGKRGAYQCTFEFSLL